MPAVLKSYLAPLAVAVLLSGCHSGRSEIVLSGPTMGTTYTVRIVSPPPEITAHDVRILVEEELRVIDLTMSGYRTDSEVTRFNASEATDWFDVSRALASVVDAALAVSSESDGAFDVTVAPLVQLWGFGPAGNPNAPVPTETEISATRGLVNDKQLHVRTDPPALRKDHAAIQIDLNGIAPGFAVDRIAKRLEALDLKHYLVDIGGEIRVRGRNKAGELWRIAVERPQDADRQPFVVLHLDNGAIATSGEYRRSVRREGKRYSHTIDPRTGAPITHSLASVVVVHEEAMYADAWATAFNVLGPVEGYELAARLSMRVMFIVEQSDGSLTSRTTPAFEGVMGSS